MGLRTKIIVNIMLSIVEFLGRDVDGFYTTRYIDPIRELIKESEEN
jgi:hypothetical protein